MKLKDIKVGMKVRLLGKHRWGDNIDNIEDWYEDCKAWKDVQKIKERGYGVVKHIFVNGDISIQDEDETLYDWSFSPEDLEPYQKFKVGDRVRVKNIPKGAISRTNLHMFDDMRKYCGKELVITDITYQHNYETSCKLIFAEEWLELVEEEKLLLPIGIKIRQVKPRFGEMIKNNDEFEVIDADKNHIFAKSIEVCFKCVTINKQEFEECWEVVKDKWEDRWHSHGLVQYKVHSNGKKVKVKIASGDVGVAICADDDEFDLEKGIKIAKNRATIKKLEKQIKKLSE